MTGGAIARCRNRVTALAADALASAREERDLVALLEAVWTLVESELSLGRVAGLPPPACGPGCSDCCTVNVGTLPLEGAVAAAHLRGLVGSREVPARAALLHAFHDRVRWLEDRERVADRLACPLLDGQGRCLIHIARPLACRSVSSLDRADCRRALREEDEPVVQMDVLQRLLHDEARAALVEALDARGLDARCRDVSGMIAAFLADPGLVPAFLGGRRVPLE